MKKRNQWKLSLDELLSAKVSLLKSNSRQLIENRLYLLAEKGYINLTYTGQHDEIIEMVEIPMNRY